MKLWQRLIITVIALGEYVLERLCRALFGPPIFSEENIEGTVAVVTGSNSGIGKEVALQLAGRGATVVMACRNLVEGKKAQDEIIRRSKAVPGQVDLVKLDLADLSSVRQCAGTIGRKYPQIHLLINNAGFYDRGPLKKTKDGFENHMGVNHLGHFLFTHLLMENIKRAAPSRIVVVASRAQGGSKLDPKDLNMEKADDLGWLNFYPYANSKHVNSLYARELGKRLRGTGVTTYSVCPGVVRSNFFRDVPRWEEYFNAVAFRIFGYDVKQGAETVIYCAVSREVVDQPSGQFYSGCKVNGFYNRFVERREKVGLIAWDQSEKLLGIKTSY